MLLYVIIPILVAISSIALGIFIQDNASDRLEDYSLRYWWRREEILWSYFVDDYQKARFLRLREYEEFKETELWFEYGHYLIEVRIRNSNDDTYKDAEATIWSRKFSQERGKELFNDIVLMGNSLKTNELSNKLARLLINQYNEKMGKGYNHDIESWWRHNGLWDREQASGIKYDEKSEDYLQITDDWWYSLTYEERAKVYEEFFSED